MHWLPRALFVTSVAGALMAAGVPSASATAYSVTFKGTRDQVRKACADLGQTAAEGANYTACGNTKNGNTVTCDDKGKCTGRYSAAVRRNDWNGALAPTVGLLMSP